MEYFCEDIVRQHVDCPSHLAILYQLDIVAGSAKRHALALVGARQDALTGRCWKVVNVSAPEVTICVRPMVKFS